MSVRDTTLAAKAGVDGVLFTVAPTSSGRGAARIALDYRGFAQAYGGGYGSRLRLVQLPQCALTTPQVTACQKQTPLASLNNAEAGSVSAPVTLSSSALVLAAVSGSSAGDGGGPSGSYAATSLKASGSWSSGGSSGSFTYTYPIAVPPAPSSLVPKADLSYDSGSVDGQTSASQAQSSWIGDGWSAGDSYIEQTFASCKDSPEGTASPQATDDQCWDGEVLTLSLNGSSTAIVYDKTKDTFTPADVNGDVITHVTGSNNGSGTHDTDYWLVTDRSGTQYSFGRNQLPGWVSGKPATNSVDYTQVYSAHSGDPCYSSSGFTSSGCLMGYRWHLDYVKDVHGNAMAYYYKQAGNKYGKAGTTTPVSYIRDSYLDHIDYGFTDGNAYGTVADRISYTTGDRCMAGTANCDPLSATTKANWPDVPFDLVCSSTTSCSVHSPSYFSTVRLTQITASQWSVSQAKFLTVDSWALAQSMPVAGDGNATVWLDSITRTGADTLGLGSAPVSTPPTVFDKIDLPNRVDTVTDGLPGLYRWRISKVTSETGGVTAVQYTRTAPCTAPVTVSPPANTSSCFPVYWTPTGYSAPFLDWFNKYAVTSVTQSDPTGGALTQSTSYAYLKPAWHFDDNEVVKAKYRTYGQWRGYQDVTTYQGDGTNDKQSKSETVYYQGMSKDNNTTPVNLTDSQGGSHEDVAQLQGRELESTAYLGDGGSVDHSTITSYWVSPALATRARTGVPDLTANLVQPVESWTRQAVTSSSPASWRVSETDTSYDTTATDPTFGQATAQYAHTVPAQSAYDRCTVTGYAKANTTANLVNLPASSETDAVACAGFTEGSVSSVPAGAALNNLSAAASVSRPSQVVSASRTFYDDATDAAKPGNRAGLTFPQSTAPSKGEASITQTAIDYSGGAFTWKTTSQVFDSVGRTTDTYDPAGNHASTTYTTDAAGLITAVKATNPLTQSTTTSYDPARGLALTSTDLNGVATNSHYDGLGRVTGVWTAGRATSSSANYTYAYTVSNTGPTSVTTQKLNDESQYQTSTVIYDALLRQRQTQSPTPQGGRLITDTFYDSRGWKSATYNGWFDSATTPNSSLASAADLKDQVPSQDYFTYDGLGRVVVDQSEQDHVEVSRTTTVYNGDRTTTIPPSGGTVTTTVTDPLGRTSELDSYSSAPTLHTPTDGFTGIWSVSDGSTQATNYGYDVRGDQTSVQAGGASWSSSYNIAGQVTAKTDADAGTTTLLYDADGNVAQTTDSLQHTISFSYDALNRKTGEYDAPLTGQSTNNQLAAWIYDNSDNAATMTYALGQLTESKSFDTDGNAYITRSTKGYNVYGESLGTTVTIPATAAAGALGGTSYAVTHTYTSTTGLPFRDIYTAVGGLPAETVSHTYTTALDLPNGLSGSNAYAQTTVYDAYSRVQQEDLGSTGAESHLVNTFDAHTGRLADQLIKRDTATPADIDDETYRYDPAGNLTRQVSTRLATTGTETQCYTYDQLDRLAAAWTATDSCAATPTAASHAQVGDQLSGGTAYWTEWSLDALGNRQQQIQHNLSGGADTTTDYKYDENGKGQPHTLTSTADSGGDTGTTSYQYDAVGNMTGRTTPATGAQTLAWNHTGQLTDVSGGTGGDAHYVYDADGNLLLQQDPTRTTLYLPGQQLTLTTSGGGAGNVVSERYYALPGGGTAVRTGFSASNSSSYCFEFADQHGTNGLTLDPAAQNPTWRQFTPYGDTRGTAPAWVDNRGFLDKPADDASGLTVVGARQYDPATGRFISLDPLFEATSPQELNGYTYSTDNPTSKSDPTGLSCHMTSDGPECFNADGNNKRGSDGKGQTSICTQPGHYSDPGCPGSDIGKHGNGSNGQGVGTLHGVIGRHNPRTPNGDGIWGSQSPGFEDYFYVNLAQTIADGSCATSLDLACQLWQHWLGNTGSAYQLSSDWVDYLMADPGVQRGQQGLNGKLSAIGAEAVNSCGSKGTCSFPVSTDWYGATTTGSWDTKYGVGHFAYRISGTADVRNGQVDVSYGVEVYKTWNFDAGKTALGIPLGPMGHVHTAGLAQDFPMLGSSNSFDWVPSDGTD